MTSRERVILSLNHKEPDMVPIDLGSSHVTGIHIDAYEKLKNYLGIKDMIFKSLINYKVLQKLTKMFSKSLILIPVPSFLAFEKDCRKMTRNGFYDEWGVTWVRKKDGGLYFELADHPFKNAEIKDIENFDWPSPDDPFRIEGLREEAYRLSKETDYALVGDIYSGCVMELIWFQTGLVRFLTDMVLDPEFIKKSLRDP